MEKLYTPEGPYKTLFKNIIGCLVKEVEGGGV